MRGLGQIAMLALLVLGAPAWGQAPDRSPLPQLRPGGENAAAAIPALLPAPAAQPTVTIREIVAGAQAPARSLRPPVRPGGTTATAVAMALPAAVIAAIGAAELPMIDAPDAREAREARVGGGFLGGIFRPANLSRAADRVAGATHLAVVQSLRPLVRPDGLEGRVRASATRLTPGRVTQPGIRGALCGVSGILGESLEPVTGRISGCGIAEAVRVREIDGITLSSPATVNCDTARALQVWLQDGAIPAVGRRGGGVASLRVVASYSCRSRNSQAGARLSEHATGNAIDIAAIGLANGSEIAVLSGWEDRREGPVLQEMHRSACGTFGTVLGPDADRFHQDHFHFDVASYRSGSYCR